MWLVSQKQEVKAAVGGISAILSLREPVTATASSTARRKASIRAALPCRRPEQVCAARRRSVWAKPPTTSGAARRQPGIYTALRDQIEMSISPGRTQDRAGSDKTGSSFSDSRQRRVAWRVGPHPSLIANEISKLDNDLFVEGHTDSRPFGTDEQCGNWELSVDRANAARPS